MTTRFNLPDVVFAYKSVSQVEASIVNKYKELTGIALGAADPRRKFIQAIVPIIAQQMSLIDFSAKQNLLAYSVGDYLDHIGEFVQTGRLQPSYATTTIRFTLSSVQSQAVTIPAGTRVTAGDNVFWATTETLTIDAGQTTGDVEAQCAIAGTAGNGYLEGEINKLVAPVQLVQSVANTTTSEGGADIESDDPYAERIQQAPESFSVAGPDGAYKYWARTANQLIVDVSVRSPEPGVVEVRPLMQYGELPGQEILDEVLAICSDRTTRPLTDQVEVLAPEEASYDITMTYYISSASSSAAVSIQAAVSQAVEDYKIWQKSKLGRSVDPSELIKLVKNAGAKRVAVTLPEYQEILSYQVAKEDTVTVTYGGLEDE